MKMIIYIVRHGETAQNKERRLQGRSNTQLNERGRQQAESVRDFFAGQRITFDRVYASPLDRARQTARIIAGEQAQIRTDERLLEMDYGPYEGSSLLEPAPEIQYFFSDFVNHPAPAGMESLDRVVRRTGSFLEELKTNAADRVLIATHAIAMKGMLAYLTPDARDSYWSLHIGNCDVYQVSCLDGRYDAPREIFCQQRYPDRPTEKE